MKEIEIKILAFLLQGEENLHRVMEFRPDAILDANCFKDEITKKLYCSILSESSKKDYIQILRQNPDVRIKRLLIEIDKLPVLEYKQIIPYLILIMNKLDISYERQNKN